MKKIIPLILIIILVTGCGCNKKEEKKEETKYNTKEEIVKEQNIEEMKIEFISLEYENKVSTLKTRVTNEKEEKQEEKYINIKYKNKEGKIVHTQLGYVKALDNLPDKIRTFNWTVFEVDGHNIKELYETIEKAKQCDGPVAIVANTIKGKGVSFMENNAGWHGKAPNKEDFERAYAEL